MESSYLDNMIEEPSMESSYLDNIIKEEKLSVCPNLFKGPTKITPKAWKTLVDWMLEVCTHSRREPDVFCLAILYLNSYMCNMDIKNERLKLIATVCLNLASKFTEKVQIKLCCLSIYEHCSYTVEEMIGCELLVLDQLNWKLNVLTPLSFHRLLLKMLNLPNMREEEEGVSEEIEKIVNQTQCDYNFFRRKPSEIAAAAILLVYNDTNPEQPSMEEASTKLLTLIKGDKKTLLRVFHKMFSLIKEKRSTSSEDEDRIQRDCETAKSKKILEPRDPGTRYFSPSERIVEESDETLRCNEVFENVSSDEEKVKGEDGNEAVENVSSDKEEVKGEDGNEASEEQEEQFKQPKKNDTIEYFNKEDDTWIRAIITSKVTQHKDWYNVRFTNRTMKDCSVHLSEETLWRFMDPTRNQYFRFKWKGLCQAMEEEQDDWKT